MSGYCAFAPGDPLHGPYHDEEYGFPVRDDRTLFERLVLEITQAGLSWGLVLRKRPAMQVAYDGFDPERVAAYGAADRERLLADPGVVRNRLKVDAAIANAGTVLALRETHGGFAGWLDAHHPSDRAGWVKLFRRTFRFTGGEITGEFLVSTGYLAGAHEPDCPVYPRVLALRPPWSHGA